jgi:carbonic anhydrase
MRLNVLLVACGLMAGSVAVHAEEKQHAHWEYSGKHGAQHWGDMDHDFAACKLGKQQSPIDIRGAKKTPLAPIKFDYTQGAAEEVNNGHTVQVNLAAGGSIKLADGHFKLVQFHFHTPGEEKINGKSFPLVAHLVHKNDAGELAVVAVLFKQGKENAALKPVFDALPSEAGGKKALEGGFNPEAMLPAKHAYYAYKGSLTTPPCSEDVRWQVLTTQSEISKEQLAAFKKLYPMNARPVQPLNGRKVLVGG